MKIDADTINVLKNFYKINTAMIFHGGNRIMSAAQMKNIKVEANVPTSFPRRFAIYELNRFIQILSTFKDPDLEFTDKAVIITENNRRISYSYAEEATINNPCEKAVVVPSVYVQFRLTEQVIQDVERAYSILKLPEIVVSGDGKNLFFQTMNTANPSGDVYSVNIGDTDKVFRAVYKAEVLTKLMTRTYDVTLSSSGVTHFVSEDGNLEYYVVFEDKPSKFS